MNTRRGCRRSLTLALLSSAILGNCWNPVSAQEIPPVGPTTPIAAPGEQTGDTHVPIGTVAQPTLADPGWVAGITLGQLYTDNLKLTSTDEKSSWVTQVQPFIKAAYNGPRFHGLLDYKLTGYLYPGDSDYNQLTNNLSAQGTLTLLPQHLFVDGTALYGSQVIDNRMPAASNRFFISNNRANVARGTISPYWIQDLGSVGTASLRYSYGRVVYNTRGISGENSGVLSGIPDITSNAVQFNVQSPKGKVWGWNLGYSEQRIEPDTGRTLDYAVGKVGTYVEVSPTIRLLADAGKESRFQRDGSVDKLGSTFWDAGFEWANGLYKLKAMVGHRFYGRSYRFSWSRTAALLTARLSYVEQPTDLNQQLLSRNPGRAITTPVDISMLPSLRERRVYIRKRATASADYRMASGQLRVRLYDERRTYLTLDDRRETVANANVDWRFDIGAFTTLTPTVGWQRYRFRDGETRYNSYEQVSLVHQFNPKNFGSVRLRHDSSNVDSASPGAHGYRANVVFVQWTHLF